MPAATLITKTPSVTALLDRALQNQAFKTNRATIDVDLLDSDILYVETEPDFSDFEKIESLQLKFPSLPIVLVASSKNAEAAVKAYRNGFSDVAFLNSDQIHDTIQVIDSLYRALRRKQEISELSLIEAELTAKRNDALLVADFERNQTASDSEENSLGANLSSTNTESQFDELAQLEEAHNERTLQTKSSKQSPKETAHDDEHHEKKEEEHFEDNFIRKLEQAMIVLDSKARILSLNRAAEQILGQDEKLVAGKRISFFLNLAEKDVQNIFSGKSHRGEIAVPNENRIIGYSISPRVLNNGQLDGAVMVFKDITEARFQRQKAEKVEKMQTLGDIAAAISHEVKNPLAGIKSIVQAMIIDMKPDTEQYQYTKQISKEVDRINAFIENTFAFARHRRLKIMRVDVSEILNAVTTLLAENLKSKGIELVKDFAPNLPQIKVDPDQLQQVILNVMINAIEAMTILPLGTPALKEKRLTISVKQSAIITDKDAKPAVEIAFQDTGLGIADTVLAKMFDPFFTTKPSGTGLGLAICFKIINEHQGRIDVSNSHEGTGAIFSIKLPVSYQSPYSVPPTA